MLAELATRPDWLLIFDNAERVGDVAGYRPSGSGHILITSRTPGWGELGGRIAIDLLDRAETMDLFRSRLPAIDDTVAEDLAGELGDLPLAVAQAVAHIEQSGMDPAEYLRQFSTRRSAFLARGEVLGYQGRVDTAWDLSLERLRATNPAALELLTRARSSARSRSRAICSPGVRRPGRIRSSWPRPSAPPRRCRCCAGRRPASTSTGWSRR